MSQSIESIVFAEQEGINFAVKEGEEQVRSVVSIPFSGLKALLAVTTALLEGTKQTPMATVEGINVGVLMMGIIPNVEGNADVNLYNDLAFTYQVQDVLRVFTFGEGEDLEGNTIVFIGENGVESLDDISGQMNAITDTKDSLADGFVVPVELLEELRVEITNRIEELNL